MRWFNFKLFFLTLCALVLYGCAAPVQNAVQFDDAYLASTKDKRVKIGVTLVDLPKPDTAFPGASCLLCIAVANAAHAALNKHVETLNANDLKALPMKLVELLKKKGLDAIVIDEPLKLASLPDMSAGDAGNKARKNFSSYKVKHGVDRLLVINIDSLGVWRSYSAYIPTDVPRAIMNGNAFIVDLTSHNLEWYLPIALSNTSEGAWDEPPKFPGLSNAYYQVIESGMDQIRKPFER
ncbi:MAG: hypothetical protein ACKVOO_03470 [Burkholderiaceae bacterium]